MQLTGVRERLALQVVNVHAEVKMKPNSVCKNVVGSGVPWWVTCYDVFSGLVPW